MKSHLAYIIGVFLLVLCGCGRASEAGMSTNDTLRLDEMAHEDTEHAEFAQKVKLYYAALEHKDWPTSYDMRTPAFKYDVSKDLYCKQRSDDVEVLASYKVLNVRMYGDSTGNFSAAEIIMEFDESGNITYSCARWIRRGGVWMCDEPGLNGVLLTSTRIPDWTTQ